MPVPTTLLLVLTLSVLMSDVKYIHTFANSTYLFIYVHAILRNS